VFEVTREGMVRSDAIHELLASFEVTRVSASVQLVLQPVFNLVLQVRRDVVAMRDVSDAGQWHSLSKLICKTRQVCLDRTHDEGILGSGQILVQTAIQVICSVRMVVRSEMGSIFGAEDLTRADEVEVGGECCETLGDEESAGFGLVLVSDLGNNFKFLFPCSTFLVHLNNPLH